MTEDNSLRIVHCFRSPVGGIFRHVRDLIKAQNGNGHSVGIICDSSTGSTYEDELFEEISPSLKLGLHRIPMRRAITPGDVATVWKTYRKINKLKPDILHSHGAKGGAYARIIGSLLRVSGSRVARLYCPHGGSIHYDRSSLKGKLFFALERFLERMTDRLIFVSKYERDGYIEKIGAPRCAYSLVYNGLSPEEYDPVALKSTAADFLYIGMMRDLKGPDLFLKALSDINGRGKGGVTANFVGDGPDKNAYLSMITELGLETSVSVFDAMPARDAFAEAKVVVVPSRAESMPYTVLEAIAAQKPIVATHVGGMPEIFEDEVEILVEADNAAALGKAMIEVLENPNQNMDTDRRAKNLAKRFSVEVMARAVESAYRQSQSGV